MANQNFRVGVSIDLTRARAELRRLEREFKEINIDFGDLREAGRSLDALRRAVERLDKSFNGLDLVSVETGFKRVANGVAQLRRALFPGAHSVNEMSDSLDKLTRNAHQAERAIDGLHRAQRAQTRAGRVGAGGRQAARSGGTPIGFAGFGSALGFLGIGGVGARFAVGAGVIAGITALGFALAAAASATFQFVSATATLASEFDLLIRRANILAGGDALGLFSDAALEQGKRTIFTANEAATALGELARAGFDTEEAIAALPGVLDLAASDSLELADATLIVARTLRSFRLDASAATTVADVLAQTAAATATSTTELANGLKFAAPFAAQLDIPLQEVAAAMGILGDNGIVATIAGTNLRFAFRSLLAPSVEAAAAIEELGIRTTNAEGDFVSFRSIIGQLAAAQEEIGNTAEFAGLVTRAFGVRASNSILTLVENFEAFKAATTENFLAFGRAAEIAEEQLAGLAGAMERLRGEVEAQQIEGFRTSGLQDELAQFARSLDTNMNRIFGAIVDPIFKEIAVGANLIRTQVLPSILLGLPGVGDNITETIGTVFDTIVAQADNIAIAIEGITVLVQGLVDTFSGIATILGPIVGIVTDLFNNLPQAVSSGLTGALAGAGIGALFGPVGALVGGIAGGLAGVVGAAFEGSSIPREAAEYGVELGANVNEGLASGLDIAEAVNAAIAEGTEPGILQGDTFDDLVKNFETARAAVDETQAKIEGFADSFLLVDGTIPADQIGIFTDGMTKLGDELALNEEKLEGSRAALQEIADSAEGAALVLGEIARAQEILNSLRERNPERAADFFLIQDPVEILSNAFAGAPLAALGKRLDQDAAALVPIIGSVGSDLLEAVSGGVVAPTRVANRLIEQHVRELAGTIEDEFRGVATGLTEAQGFLLDSLEGFQGTVQNIQATFSGFRITEVLDLESNPDSLLVSGLDFSAIFAPPSPEELEKQADEVEKTVEPTVRSTINGLFDMVNEISGEIGDKRADELRGSLRSIFSDDDLTLAEQALAGAFLVDQAFAEEQAAGLLAQLETIFARFEEISAEQEAGEFTIPFNIPEEDRLGAEEFLAGRSTELANQQSVLLELVNSGNTILATAAATNDTVLTDISEGFGIIEDMNTRAQELVDGAEAEVGVITNDEEFAAAQEALTGLGEQAGALGPDISAGLETDLAGVPSSLVDPFVEGVENITGFLETGSPSQLFVRVGGDMVAGLRIGWTSSFPFFSALVISNFANMIQILEAIVRNADLTPTLGSTGGTTIPGTVRHSGGYIYGQGEVDARLLAGEFVLRRGAVESLARIGVDPNALNRDPRQAMYDAANVTNNTTNQTPVSVNQNFEIHTAATQLSERRLMREAERQLVRHAKRAF